MASAPSGSKNTFVGTPAVDTSDPDSVCVGVGCINFVHPAPVPAPVSVPEPKKPVPAIFLGPKRAGYAERFPVKPPAHGTSVVIDEGQVRAALPHEVPVGIVSHETAIVTGTGVPVVLIGSVEHVTGPLAPTPRERSCADLLI